MWGASAQITAMLMRELTGKRTVMTLPSAGTTRPFDFTIGRKQGGVETPEEWLAIIEGLMEPLADVRATRGFGFPLTQTEGVERHVCHAVWAYTLILFAVYPRMLPQMIYDLTEAVYRAGLDRNKNLFRSVARRSYGRRIF